MAMTIEATEGEVEAIEVEVEAIGVEVEAMGMEVEAMGVEVEAMGVEVEAMGVEVEAMGVEGDQEGTMTMQRAEKVMHCSLAAASVALFVAHALRKFQCVQYLHRSLVEGVLHLESKQLC